MNNFNLEWRACSISLDYGHTLYLVSKPYAESHNYQVLKEGVSADFKETNGIVYSNQYLTNFLDFEMLTE